MRKHILTVAVDQRMSWSHEEAKRLNHWRSLPVHTRLKEEKHEKEKYIWEMELLVEWGGAKGRNKTISLISKMNTE